MNWLTPTAQKSVALAFVVSWYLAQQRFTAFFKALTGQVTISA